jgi:hypothetical protein
MNRYQVCLINALTGEKVLTGEVAVDHLVILYNYRQIYKVSTTPTNIMAIKTAL